MKTAAELFNLGISSTSVIMLRVILALLPGIMVSVYFFGMGFLLNIVTAVLLAILFEAIALWIRKRKAAPSLKDGSIVLAAVLFALALPPLLPLWQLIIGIVAMVLLGKQLFGGLGQNPFNPAMVGYAILLVSFPLTMTTWPTEQFLASLSLSDVWEIKISGNITAVTPEIKWDALTGATPLDRIATSSNPTAHTMDMSWRWINMAFLIGGIYLLINKTIRWHIPGSLLLAFCLLSLVDSLLIQTPLVNLSLGLFSGALMLGAFFIATDPVTAAASPTGRIVYGAGIGVLVFLLRKYSAYPEGIAFAVLLMNLCVPAIDALTLRTGRVR